jgi:hypothetical protein
MPTRGRSKNNKSPSLSDSDLPDRLRTKQQALIHLAKNYGNPDFNFALTGQGPILNYYKGLLNKKDVTNFLHGVYGYVQSYLFRRSKHMNVIFSYCLRQNMQMDHGYFEALKHENLGYRYILILVDCFSKYVWLSPQKTLSTEETARSFTDIYHRMPGRKQMRAVTSDKASYFKNKKFKKVLADLNGITLRHPSAGLHAFVAERYLRHLKRVLYLFLKLNKTRTYIHDLGRIEQLLNGYPRRSLPPGMTPFEAENKANSTKIRAWNESTLYHNLKKQEPKFKIGDKVFLSQARRAFQKEHDGSTSSNLYVITKVDTKLHIPSFSVKEFDSNQDVAGQFYAHELCLYNKDEFEIKRIVPGRTKKIGGKPHVLVIWKHDDGDKFDHLHSGWVLKNSIVYE